jgi:hypothetical protein
MRLKVTDLDQFGTERGSRGERLGYLSSVTNTTEPEVIAESAPLGGWNTQVLSGSFDLVP